MDNYIDYNYLKTLPKDLLIKILTEVNEENLKDKEKEKREWFVNIMNENGMIYCNTIDCYRISHMEESDFIICENCEAFYCPDCQDDIGFRFCVECGLFLCLPCNNSVPSNKSIKYCETCNEYFCEDCKHTPA